MLISNEYKELMQKSHELKKTFGVSGSKWTDHVMGIAAQLNTFDVLDYGCGKSTLANNLPFPIKQYDPGIIKYSTEPEPADLVVCTDVLEHIEPECLIDVINHLQSLIKQVGFFVICLVPSIKHLPDGRNAHLSVFPSFKWFEILEHYFIVTQFNLIGRDATFIVHKKVRDNA